MSNNIESDETIKSLIVIPFTTEREAKIAFNSLRIDKEFNYRNISFNNNLLIIEYKTNKLKQMRVCLKSILELLEIVIQAIDCFDLDSIQTRS